MGAVFWLTGSRRTLARFAAAEDLPDPALVMLRDRAPGLMRLLLNDRDAQLAAALDQVLARTSDEPADIAVVYGAAHMPALTRHLQSRYGFRPRAADWLTVFDF
jgi:pheromone shutdown protein TraB